MYTRQSVIGIRRMLMTCGIALILGASAAVAADPPQAKPAAPSKEMREKMAIVHEQMAACLRSDRPISECRTDMMKKCQEMMGEQGCPMMQMHKQMMMAPPAKGVDHIFRDPDGDKACADPQDHDRHCTEER